MSLETRYLGLSLPHPFIAGASPFGYAVDRIKRLEDAGCAAVVLHSLFEEQISAQQGRVAGYATDDDAFAHVLADFPAASEYPLNPEQYAEHIQRAKAAVRIPIIASLNGRTRQSWLKMARTIEQAGADALELNIYSVMSELGVPGAHVEAELVGVVEEVKRLIAIPVAVKLSPFFAAFGHVANRLDHAGADAVQMVSALLRHGPAYIETMRRGLADWLEWNGVSSVDAMKGAVSLKTRQDPGAFERAHYIRVLHSWTK